jgi:hypothetical protein
MNGGSRFAVPEILEGAIAGVSHASRAGVSDTREALLAGLQRGQPRNEIQP